jgi:hypothetical protein
LPPGVLDIERLLEYADPKDIDHADLVKLDRDTVKSWRGGDGGNSAPSIDFHEWRRNRLKKWKLCGWESDASVSESAMKIAKQRFGVEEVTDFLNVPKGLLVRNDWVLTVKTPDLTNMSWLHVNFVVKLDKSYPNYEKGYPFQAVQANASKNCPPPPFSLNPNFRKGFRQSVDEYGLHNFDKLGSLFPPKKFLDLLDKNVRSA